MVGSEKIEYINGETEPLDEVYLHLWPNAFLSATEARPDIFLSNGSITIDSVTDETGLPLPHQITEDTNLMVNLSDSVEPGESTAFRINFSVSIPNSKYMRFGYWDKPAIHSLGNWYPVVAVYDEDGWDTSPYTFMGESFYADVSLFDVNITVPADQVIAALGALTQKIVNPDDTVTWTWKTGMVRDFFFASSPDFEVASRMIGDIEISSYYFQNYTSRGLAALDTAENSVKVFGSLFKPYPYPTLSIVQSLDRYLGMEYPNLVLMGYNLYNETLYSLADFEEVLSHELGHQWFAYMVGNDPYCEPWLDEGFATYSEIIYFEFVHGPTAKESLLRSRRNSYFSALSDESVNHTMEFWESVKIPRAYSPIVYAKGCLIIEMLRLEVGNSTFFEALQKYTDDFLYKNARISDLIAVFEEAAGYDLDWFFEEWIFGRGIPRYSLNSTQAHSLKDGYRLVLNVTQEAYPKKMLVPFKIVYQEGSETRTAWVNETQQTIEFNLDKKPIRVIMDPDYLILRTPRGPISLEVVTRERGDNTLLYGILISTVVAISLVTIYLWMRRWSRVAED